MKKYASRLIFLWVVILILSFPYKNSTYEADANVVQYVPLFQFIWVVGPIITFLIYRLVNFRLDQKRRQKLEEQTARDQLERLQKEIERHVLELQYLSTQATDLFNVLPHYLDKSEKYADQASKDYQNHAYSPFWSQIETSYQYLDFCKSNLDGIAQLAVRYAEAIKFLRLLGMSDPLPLFPIDLNSKEMSKVLENASAQLSKMSYEAQRNATFAVIWEQRRTTTVVEMGFKSLEAAVMGMTGAIVAAIGRLEEKTSEVSRVIQVSARDSSDQNAILISQNSQVLDAARHQIASQRSQNDSLREISRAAHFVEWGHHQI